MHKKQAKIGITLDFKEDKTYSDYPWFALRQNYAMSLVQAGAVPFPLVADPKLVDAYLDTIDGLVISGGFFDVGPELYGETSTSAFVKPVPTRTNFELAIIQGALARKMPLLGICGGEQILNVVLGGTLVQHIPDTYPGCLEHEQKTAHHLPSHEVFLEPGSLLAQVVGGTKIEVNSSHHQAVGKLGKGVRVNAKAPDQVIEGIEVEGQPFCLGVQWHPEYGTTQADQNIIQAFVKAADEGRHA